MEDTHTSKPKVSARKRRGGTKKVDRIIDDDTPPALTKEELRAKLREKMKLKKQMKELEAVDDQEMNNEGGRTIPEYD